MILTLTKRIESLESARRPTKVPAQPDQAAMNALFAKLDAILKDGNRESARRAKLPIDEQIELLDKDREAEIAERAKRRTSDAIPTNLDALMEHSYALRRAELVARRDGAPASAA